MACTAIFLLLIIGPQAATLRPGPPQVAVEARYAATPEPGVDFDLHARDDQAIYESDLPWGNFYSVTLTFRDSAGKEVCPLLEQPIDDPSDVEVTLQAGQFISGRVALLPYCRSLPDLLTRGPVTVDWAYTPAVYKLKGKPIHGQIVVPAKE